MFVKIFGVLIGLFDYIFGFVVVVVFIVCGVCIIEKYIILVCVDGGLDVSFLLEFDEFK